MSIFDYYFSFFSTNRFAESDELKFFLNGCFTIATKEKKVSLYSSKAELIASYEDAFVLDNGIICVTDSLRKCIGVFLFENYLFSIPLDRLQIVVPMTNAFMLYDKCSEKNALYLFSADGKQHQRLPFEKRMHPMETSSDGKVWWLNNIYTGPVRTSKDLLTDSAGKEIPLLRSTDSAGKEIPMFRRFNFLPNGAYIVCFNGINGGCALYSKKNELLLQSCKSDGIRPLGHVVLYEDKLLVTSDGHIIGEYNKEIDVFDGIPIYPYKIGKHGHWLGGKMECATIEAGSLLYYWHDGVYYLYSKACEQIYSSTLSRQPLYRMRLSEMIPD